MAHPVEREIDSGRCHVGMAPGEGRHERYVVPWDKFNARVAEKATKIQAGAA